VVREAVPRVDGNLDERLEPLVEQEPAREAVLQGHLLASVRHQEEDAIGRRLAPGSERDEALLEHAGLTGPRAPQHLERPDPVIDDPLLLGIERDRDGHVPHFICTPST
jgi:hypothetical protein